MNSSNEPLPKLSNITPHRSTATSAPEMVESIPIKNQNEELKPAANPISSPRKASIDDISSNDEELDRDLRAASQRIKHQTEPHQSKFNPPIKSEAKNGVKKDRRIANFLPVVAAVLVAGALSAAAFYAYDQTQQDQRLSSQVRQPEASSTANDNVITPNDLEAFSQSVNTDLYDFDDSKDFDQQELSDQVLGL